VTTWVSKWGNSLALRIPKTLAAELNVQDGDAVDVSLEGGAIVVRPAARRYSIDDLVEGITPRNRHKETDWGTRTGRETW
jgi:antitoxin MazE